jgi:hypothetical protein
MLIEVSVLQRFVLLLGHPVYSLTVTLFSLLLGTGLGAAWSRRLGRSVAPPNGSGGRGGGCRDGGGRHVDLDTDRHLGDSVRTSTRMLIAVALLLPMGVALGVPMPTGLRPAPSIRTADGAWAWGSTARCRSSGRRWPSSSR